MGGRRPPAPAAAGAPLLNERSDRSVSWRPHAQRDVLGLQTVGAAVFAMAMKSMTMASAGGACRPASATPAAARNESRTADFHDESRWAGFIWQSIQPSACA